MYNECNSLTSWYIFFLDRLTCLSLFSIKFGLQTSVCQIWSHFNIYLILQYYRIRTRTDNLWHLGKHWPTRNISFVYTT